MNEQILQNIERYGASIISFFGKLNPIAGAVVSVIIGALLVFLGIKVKREKKETQTKTSGESIAKETAKDQEIVTDVQDSLDDFFKK